MRFSIYSNSFFIVLLVTHSSEQQKEVQKDFKASKGDVNGFPIEVVPKHHYDSHEHCKVCGCNAEICWWSDGAESDDNSVEIHDPWEELNNLIGNGGDPFFVPFQIGLLLFWRQRLHVDLFLIFHFLCWGVGTFVWTLALVVITALVLLVTAALSFWGIVLGWGFLGFRYFRILLLAGLLLWLLTLGLSALIGCWSWIGLICIFIFLNKLPVLRGGNAGYLISDVENGVTEVLQKDCSNQSFCVTCAGSCIRWH